MRVGEQQLAIATIDSPTPHESESDILMMESDVLWSSTCPEFL